MKRTICLLFLAIMVAFPVIAQDEAAGPSAAAILGDPASFRNAVDLQTSLLELNDAVGDMALLEEMAGRVLILDGIASSITVFSEEPDDFYIELEMVGGRWDGVQDVTLYRAFVFLDDPAFAGRLAEQAPRNPDPELILRNDRILIAGRLVSLAEDPEGRPVPVLHAYEIRAIR